VRIIGNRLDEKAIAQRIKNKKNKKKNLTDADRLASQLNLFVTNVPHTHCTADELYQLYKIRWQVELVFKTWKSVLKIDQVRKMKATRLKRYLISKLLWIMLSWEICTLHQPLIWQNHQRLISPYKCFSLLKLQVHKIKGILSSSVQHIQHWRRDLYTCFVDYGLKEDRNERISLINLLRMDNYKPPC
jgi:hypothetical protein